MYIYIYIYMYTCMQKNDYICRRIFGSHKKKKKTIPGFKDLADKHKSVWMGTSMGFANRKEHKVSFC